MIAAAGRERADDGRDETEAERLDRNYAELLQELRVAQTGVQILFAFLLGIAFQQRFTTIDQAQRVLYLITLTSAATAAVLLIAPVAAHRVLFRRNRKDEVVAITSRLASAGLACLAVAILSAVVLVVDFVTGVTVALTITITLGVIVAITWLVVPLLLRRRPEE
ncbi:MAG TPA: DUF6328 family protein [Jatrophihabitans sp.]|uniref:DUF6328 family protein n=1 Tax=Jatrophihabitans sp. TaxID=1932789 RepID=UPI002DF9518E|nr:DUF6328 family protein [Jatrophihabitans sp.]